MAIDKLNANQIRNARCGKHFDGAGLFLQVLASGNRYWRMKYYYGGREKLIAFGVYPEVSLAEARQRRDEARTLLRQGRDPVMARRAERREAVARASNNFETVCLEWVRVKGYRWSEGHRLGVMSQMENDELLFPHRSGGGQAMTKSGLRKAMAYAGFQGEATIHGFRALASTELNERGFHADAIERQLAHEEANKSRRAYNRASYLEERCKMMDAWSGLLACEKRTAAMLLLKRPR